MGPNPWGHKESDTTERLTHSHLLYYGLVLTSYTTTTLFPKKDTFLGAGNSDFKYLSGDTIQPITGDRCCIFFEKYNLPHCTKQQSPGYR